MKDNGLHVTRRRTCPCGKVFEAKSPEAKYCPGECRRRFSRYGRSYGQTEQRPVDRAFR